MKKHPNPNLWNVTYTSQLYPGGGADLLILAPTAASAEKKARRVLKRDGATCVRITSISHEGAIDAF